MKQIFKAGVVMLACFGLTAVAQDWYHDREQRFHGEEWHRHLFEHVKMDLEHLPSAAFAAPREQRRLQRTREELSDLQGKMDRRFFDQAELKDVTDSLRKSANDQRMSPQDRDVVADDLRRLEEFRAHHDEWWAQH